MKTCRYAPMETCRYTPMWSCRYAPHEDMPAYSHVVMPVCSHVVMPVCSHGDMPVCLQCTVVEHSFPKHPNVLDGKCSKGKGFPPPPPFLLRWHHLELPAPPLCTIGSSHTLCYMHSKGNYKQFDHKTLLSNYSVWPDQLTCITPF